jgi:transposase
LHQLGFSYKKPKHIPGKANQKAQEEFIARYTQLKETKSPEDRIYFMDGVHPLHNSQPAYGWIRKGKEQALKANTGRMRVNINGAYDIENQKVIIREDESINSQSTIALLEQMLKEQPFGILYIILDNARYYRSQIVKEYLEKNQRVQFVFLPPYSPNLNIIERLWKLFKKKTTYNKYYEKFAVFKEKCMGFFENIDKYKIELDSLMTDNFQLIQA